MGRFVLYQVILEGVFEVLQLLESHFFSHSLDSFGFNLENLLFHLVFVFVVLQRADEQVFFEGNLVEEGVAELLSAGK